MLLHTHSAHISTTDVGRSAQYFTLRRVRREEKQEKKKKKAGTKIHSEEQLKSAKWTTTNGEITRRQKEGGREEPANRVQKKMSEMFLFGHFVSIAIVVAVI